MEDFKRLRRMRKTTGLRRLVQETTFRLDDLIYPIFVDEDILEPTSIETMPGILKIPEKMLNQELKSVWDTGIRSIILFGTPKNKDAIGQETWQKNGLLSRMISRAKEAEPDMNVIADTCFCEYTDHGHCGVLTGNDVDNDLTLDNLTKQAITAIEAGADVLAPSGMMDGMIRTIRNSIDESGFTDVPIISYSTKFASSFYGPFREAAGVTKFVDRRTYQLDPANKRASIMESMQDEIEGCDALMVKPGIAYLDILAEICNRSLLPVGAYQVSGEYAMIKYAAKAGAINEEAAVMETLLAFKRAGANFILTYFAKDIQRYLENQ